MSDSEDENVPLTKKLKSMQKEITSTPSIRENAKKAPIQEDEDSDEDIPLALIVQKIQEKNI